MSNVDWISGYIDLTIRTIWIGSQHIANAKKTKIYHPGTKHEFIRYVWDK